MVSKKKCKRSNKTIMLCLILFLVVMCVFIVFNIKDKNSTMPILDDSKEIEKHYNEFVKTNKDAILYNEKNEEVGKVGKDVELTLNNIDIDKDTKYFNIKNIEGYYIKYIDVDIIDKLTDIDERYKEYIPFNQNVVTNDITNFYDENGDLIYSLKNEYSLPIIIKDIDRYGVEFDNKLLYINKDDVKELIDNHNTDKSNSDGIPVLNYHFVYEEDDPCYEEICHSSKQIKEHFSYIKDNDFFTPTMKELEMYIDNNLQLPQKSVVITFDDGGRADVAKKYVDEYKINATLFLITSWFDKKQFESEYFEVHSHGDDIHNGGLCLGGQGGEIKCMEHDELLADLKTSRDKLDGSTVFCYPFYEYNDYSIEVLKEAGFTMAFAGERAGGKIKVTPGIDKFRLPRWVIVNYTTQNQFISYVNGGS